MTTFQSYRQRTRIMVGFEHPTCRLRDGDVAKSPPSQKPTMSFFCNLYVHGGEVFVVAGDTPRLPLYLDESLAEEGVPALETHEDVHVVPTLLHRTEPTMQHKTRALWRNGSDCAQQSYDCGFKSQEHCILQGELL